MRPRGLGLLSHLNGASVVALGFGSCAVASAIFLILELSRPYTGLFRIPSASMERTLKDLNDPGVRNEQLQQPPTNGLHSSAILGQMLAACVFRNHQSFRSFCF